MYSADSQVFSEEGLTTRIQDTKHLSNRINPLEEFDRFQGVATDPQSLHKYGYAHANPVFWVDPSGESVDISLTSILKVTAIAAIIAGIYYTPSLFQASRTAPRTVMMDIHVSTQNRPINFDRSAVEKNLQDLLSTKVFNGLVAGQSVNVTLIDSSSPPGNLEWSGNPNMKYVGWVRWTDKRPLGGLAISGNGSTAIYASGIANLVANVPDRDWDHIYANFLAHEMIWLNAGGNIDGINANAGEISSNKFNPRGPASIDAESRESLIDSFELRSKR